MSTPSALVIKAPGTNRDGEAAYALELAGAVARIALLQEVLATPALLDQAALVVIPGGFSFADALGAGRLLALELTTRLADGLRGVVAAGKPVIGICNGFQTLIRTGLLPGDGLRVALGHNHDAAGQPAPFVCEWVELQPVSTRCIWTAPLTERIHCPVAHGEGRLAVDDQTLAALQLNDQIALTYAGHNPNGSRDAIAGLCDATGLVLGLMPHPEDHVLGRQHPRHQRGYSGGLGLGLFTAGVRHAAQL